MEFEVSDAIQVPSNSMQDSILTIPLLPLELITEILLRLPVKSLLKFRYVSQSWLALISNPVFIKTDLSLSANNKNTEDTHHVIFLDIGGKKWNYKECPLKSLFYDSVTVALELDFSIENDRYWLYVKGSGNGLVYLAHDGLEYSLLWNSTTRKHKNLPLFRPRLKKYERAYGFGYNELHDDYKVVIISYNYIVRGSDDIEVKAYSLKSDSWTSVDYCDETFSNKKSVGRNIIAFDLANEKWEKVEKPSYGEGETELLVGKLGSHLSVFCDYKTTHLGAWVMKEYGVKECWIKMFTIRYPNDPEWYPTFFMSNKGEILSV
ncbi:F-box/kelch-repeat protein At3g06240-like [Solanum verrucosum]|uniref:F-box/kelch-repeat protein At3g06240-like n=1 Tax=Solanum verrucosum TaxID=315347 RepID=UPI0020D03330|nr:F-box/kelch-repeat protein At3g06240-like [Solanum verrucosum]